MTHREWAQLKPGDKIISRYGYVYEVVPGMLSPLSYWDPKHYRLFRRPSMKFAADNNSPHYPKTYLDGHLEISRTPSGAGFSFRAKWLDSFGQTLATGQWCDSEDLATRSLALQMRVQGQNMVTYSEELINGTDDTPGA